MRAWRGWGDRGQGNVKLYCPPVCQWCPNIYTFTALKSVKEAPLPSTPMWGGFDRSRRSPQIFSVTPPIFPLLLGVWGKGWQGWVGEFKGLGRDFRIAVKTRPFGGRFSPFLGRNSASLGPICTPQVRQVVLNTLRTFSATL